MSAVTATPLSVRPHVMVAQIEAESGYRYWSESMSNMELSMWVSKELAVAGNGLSDYCCSMKCWCV